MIEKWPRNGALITRTCSILKMTQTEKKNTFVNGKNTFAQFKLMQLDRPWAKFHLKSDLNCILINFFDPI